VKREELKVKIGAPSGVPKCNLETLSQSRPGYKSLEEGVREGENPVFDSEF